MTGSGHALSCISTAADSTTQALTRARTTVDELVHGR